jgi:hypothetical protein
MSFASSFCALFQKWLPKSKEIHQLFIKPGYNLQYLLRVTSVDGEFTDKLQ